MTLYEFLVPVVLFVAFWAVYLILRAQAASTTAESSVPGDLHLANRPRAAICCATATEPPMQTRNKILDDLAHLMSNAMGVAQGAKVEAETAMKSLVDRWLADRNFVTREEFDAVRAMAQKAREENEALKARIAALESAGAGPSAG